MNDFFKKLINDNEKFSKIRYKAKAISVGAGNLRDDTNLREEALQLLDYMDTNNLVFDDIGRILPKSIKERIDIINEKKYMRQFYNPMSYANQYPIMDQYSNVVFAHGLNAFNTVESKNYNNLQQEVFSRVDAILKDRKMELCTSRPGEEVGGIGIYLKGDVRYASDRDMGTFFLPKNGTPTEYKIMKENKISPQELDALQIDTHNWSRYLGRGSSGEGSKYSNNIRDPIEFLNKNVNGGKNQY